MTADGNLYTGTVTDFTGRDPAICRIMGPSKHLRSVQRNNKWLHGMFYVNQRWDNIIIPTSSISDFDSNDYSDKLEIDSYFIPTVSQSIPIPIPIVELELSQH